jgi:hypothetical protein
VDTATFLRAVVTADQPGYFCLAVSDGKSGWLENWFQWPADIEQIVQRAEQAKSTSNVYFSSYLFKAPQSTKANVLRSRTIQADLDDADVTKLPKAPTVLVETSPGRHQGYWVINEQLDLDTHEGLSKKLTYSIPLCDRSGWPLGKKVRIPGTLNHKYPDGPKEVKIVSTNPAPLGPEEFEALPEVSQTLTEHFDATFIERDHIVQQHPVELLERIKNDIPVQVYINFDRRQNDRSEALWALMCWAFKCGLNRDEVFTLSQASANNKHADKKYRADADLARDVLRAEHAVKTNQQDPKQTIYTILKSSIQTIDKRRTIFSAVLDEMRKQGVFLHTTTGKGWYIRSDVGRPIAVELLSEKMRSMLDIQFGLNQTEPESKYVIAGLKAHISTLPETAIEAALSRFNPHTNTMLLHTGKRMVINVTADEIVTSYNGYEDVVFPWIPSVEPFTPNYRQAVDWGSELFGDGSRGYGSGVDNITNMTPTQAMALFKTWFLFVLFRDAAHTRPVIANIGQPGSGKTCIFKRIYTTLYGRRKSIGAVTTQEDFDHTVATEPLLVLDNVDTWERWLPDRLALSAGTTDHNKRKLYSDSDSVTMRRQAILGVTAHNPKFGREDVADRFLLFTFSRFENFISEELILSDLNEKRNVLWGAIVQDIQRVLRTPLPTTGVPQFRIEDFARYGLWIARALGCERDFVSAIEDVKSAQQTFSLEEEGLLVGAVKRFVNQTKEPKSYTAAQLWSMLEASADDAQSFKVAYRNSVILGKKLSAMQAALQKIIHIEQHVNGDMRTWTLRKKDTV